MSISPIFFAIGTVLAIGFGIASGRAEARRSRELWKGIKEGRPGSLAVVAVVGIYVLYVWLSYTPPE